LIIGIKYGVSQWQNVAILDIIDFKGDIHIVTSSPSLISERL
jgi:hypothetical protein